MWRSGIKRCFIQEAGKLPPNTHLPMRNPASVSSVTSALEGIHKAKQQLESLPKPPQSKQGFHQLPRKDLM